MEIQDSTAKQAYIRLLIDASIKKKSVLGVLIDVTQLQEELLESEAFDEDRFQQTISSKEENLKTLSMLDEGFEKVYKGVKKELSENRLRYSEEIITLQGLISEITDLSMKLQALEKRNKLKLEFVLTNKRRDIQKMRLSSKTVANYYQSMSKQNDIQSLFYDKKN